MRIAVNLAIQSEIVPGTPVEIERNTTLILYDGVTLMVHAVAKGVPDQ